MTDIRSGAIPLFRFSGIQVYLHWSWFLVAAFEISDRASAYSSIRWNVLEYLLLFFIVTLHEFGHALACRQVGGTADRIVLWPLGGVAYVSPPPRPGATLWSIAAGPLVNLILVPILMVLTRLSQSLDWAATMPNAAALLRSVLLINVGLLVFNLLPIYPLDGGQILRSLLWFPLGRARSLIVATVLGFIGAAGLVALAFRIRSIWIGLIAVYVLMNCQRAWQQAQALSRLAKLPRRQGFACPACKMPPPVADVWLCGNCRIPFDTFSTNAVCPKCGTQFPVRRCLDCGRTYPMSEWIMAAAIAPSLN